MTNLFYMLMKFVIRNEFLVAEFTIENDQNLFNEYHVRYILIVVQIIVIVLFCLHFVRFRQE